MQPFTNHLAVSPRGFRFGREAAALDAVDACARAAQQRHRSPLHRHMRALSWFRSASSAQLVAAQLVDDGLVRLPVVDQVDGELVHEQ